MINYIKKEQATWLSVSSELLAQYNDGSHTRKNKYGELSWWQNGQVHRDDDKPAYIGADGTLTWYQNGLYHRDGDKPARILSSGTLTWWQNGQMHRICGPAVIYASGTLEWYINDENITLEVNEWLNRKRWRGTPEQIFEFKLRFS